MTIAADLAAIYRQKITSGGLRRGERLPVEGELAELHGVSIATVSRFVKIMKSEGLLHTTHAGTFVGPRPPDPRQGKGTWEITCANRPWCNNILELRRVGNAGALVNAAGWIWRGSPHGHVYFCHQCAQEVREDKDRKGAGPK